MAESTPTPAIDERITAAFGAGDATALNGWLEQKAEALLAAITSAGLEGAAPTADFGAWAVALSEMPAPFGELAAKHGTAAKDAEGKFAAAVAAGGSGEPAELDADAIRPLLRGVVFELYGGLLVVIEEKLADRGYSIGPLGLWLDESRRDEIELAVAPVRAGQLGVRMDALVTKAEESLAAGDAKAALAATVEGLRELWSDVPVRKLLTTDDETFLAALTRLRLAAVEAIAQKAWEAGELQEALRRYEQLFAPSATPPPTVVYDGKVSADGALQRAILRAIYVDETREDAAGQAARRLLQQAIWFWGRLVYRRYVDKGDEPWHSGEGLGSADEGAFNLLRLYCTTHRPDLQQTAEPLYEEPIAEIAAEALALDPSELRPRGYHIGSASIIDGGFARLYATVAAPHAVDKSGPLSQLASGEVGARRKKLVLFGGIGVAALLIVAVVGYFVASAVGGESGPPPLSKEEQAQTVGNGWSPVHAKAAEGDRPAFERLLVLQLPLDATDNEGESLVHKAVRRGDAEAIKELKLLGANVNLENGEGKAPLLLAVAGDSTPVVEALLSAKANPEVHNAKGQTPLLIAVERGSRGHVIALIGGGAAPSAVDGEKQSALHIAASTGFFDAAEALLEANADLELADAVGETPMHRATRAEKEDIINLLVGSGAEVNARNAEGCTAFDLAKRDKLKEIAKLLKRLGGKRKCKGKPKGKGKGKGDGKGDGE